MASGATSKYQLPYPQPGDTPNIPADIQGLANALDAIIATAYQGTGSSRPAAGKSGRSYYATDTGVLSLDTGSAWITLGVLGGSASTLAKVVPSSAGSLGSSPFGAKLDHSHPMDALPVGSGAVLDVCRYAPSTAVVLPSGAGGLAAFDATHLTVAFTAPPSGSVLVSLSACIEQQYSYDNFFGLADHTTHAQVGDAIHVSLDAAYVGQVEVTVLVAGLTAGAAYQWDFAGALAGSGTFSLYAASGTPNTNRNGGPALMVVTAV